MWGLLTKEVDLLFLPLQPQGFFSIIILAVYEGSLLLLVMSFAGCGVKRESGRTVVGLTPAKESDASFMMMVI